MCLPNVSWNLEAETLLDYYVRFRKPITSKEFTSELRLFSALQNKMVLNKDVGEWLRHKFKEGALKNYTSKQEVTVVNNLENHYVRYYVPLHKRLWLKLVDIYHSRYILD